MVKVKVCGLRRPEDIQIVNRYLPDYAGFVFAKSRRQVTEEQAEALAELLDSRITPVGVFVNEEKERIERLCRKGIIRQIQLHGDEDPNYIEAIQRGIPGVPVIKAVRVRRKEQVLEAEKQKCDFLLLDTYSKDMYGGCGHTFDWKMIPELTKPYFLAGGLSSENVRESIRKTRAYGVDVSSAVETDGVKDEEKVRKFIERVRNYE